VCGCTTTNLPLSNDIKTTSKFQRILDEVVLSYFVVQQRDGQTDRQTDRKLNIFGCHGGVRSPYCTGMVIDDLEHVLSPVKCLGIRCIVSPLEGAIYLAAIKTPVALETLDRISRLLTRDPAERSPRKSLKISLKSCKGCARAKRLCREIC